MKRKIFLIGLLLAQVSIAVFAAVSLWAEDRAAEMAEKDFRELASMTSPTDVAALGDTATPAVASSAHDHKALKEKNPDYIGWLSIEGTNLDYPVMQAPKDEPEFYLTHDFQKGNAKYGVPFLDSRCEMGRSDHLIIYGHHTADETMFSVLHRYQEKDFWKEHQTILFETPQEDKEYTVFAVLRARGAYTADSWSIFQCLDQSQKEFAKMKQEVNARRLYDTNLFPTYGDELLTLVTCEYSQENSRLVVLAYHNS